MQRPLVIFGAGGLGQEIYELAQQINRIEPVWDVLGFVDDFVEEGTIVCSLPVLGGREWLIQQEQYVSVIIAIGDPLTKKKVAETLRSPYIKYPVLIHPSVIAPARIKENVGYGSVIAAGNILTTNISIGRHVLLNLACTIGHDSVISDYCSIMPGVRISGEVTLEEGVYLGTASKIINKLSIGEYAIIGAGAVVTQSLPAKCTAVGIPAKPVKYHQ